MHRGMLRTHFATCENTSGGIGSGKSTVGQFLKTCGETVIDADDLARDVVKKGSEGLAKIISEFGSQVLAPNGELDRHVLGQIVFSDSYKLAKLEKITHPEVNELFQKLVQQFQLTGRERIFYECPLLFEHSIDQQCKASILVTCPEETRIQRIMARSGLPEGQVRKIMAEQLPDLDKAKKATYIIRNDSDLESLHRKTLVVRDSLIAHHTC